MHVQPWYRPLIAPADHALVAEFYTRAADYIWLETSAPPSDQTASAYFTGALPGHDPAADLREGLFQGALLAGIAELAFACPQPGCATLTLMILAPEARGAGLGAAWAQRLCQIAGENGAAHLHLSVLRRNKRGLRFWRRAGFRLEPALSCAAGLGEAGSRLHLTRPLP